MRNRRQGYLALAVVAASFFGAAGEARAHADGASRSELSLGEDGVVRGRFVFQGAELARALSIDANGDGRLEDAELRKALLPVREFLDVGVAVDADDAPCRGGFVRAAIDEEDGLAFDAAYTCPKGAARLAVTYYFLSDLAPSHRHAASLAVPGATTERLLSGTARAIALVVPGRGASADAGAPVVDAERRATEPEDGGRAGRLLFVAFLVTSGGALLWGVRRVTRKRVSGTSEPNPAEIPPRDP